MALANICRHTCTCLFDCNHRQYNTLLLVSNHTSWVHPCDGEGTMYSMCAFTFKAEICLHVFWFSMASTVSISSLSENPSSLSMALMAWVSIIASKWGLLWLVLGLPETMSLSESMAVSTKFATVTIPCPAEIQCTLHLSLPVVDWPADHLLTDFPLGVCMFTCLLSWYSLVG